MCQSKENQGDKTFNIPKGCLGRRSLEYTEINCQIQEVNLQYEKGKQISIILT